jgi:glycosyltransferase involved in cell wall biosynthesis
LLPYLQAAQIMVAPAAEPEGLGLAVAEALLCETPVIASNIGGLPDLVEDNVTGRLVAPRDPQALASTITEALTDTSRLAAWGREGRIRVLRRFDPALCASRYIGIYEEVVRGARA